MPNLELTTPAAKAGYEAYCNFTGNKSLVTGADLPFWDNLPDNIKSAWEASARAIEEFYRTGK